MKATGLDRNEDGPANSKPAQPTVCSIEEENLFVEELEDVIAPKLSANHNETMVRDHP